MNAQEYTAPNSLLDQFEGVYQRLAGAGLDWLGSLRGEVVIRKMTRDEEDDAKNMVRSALLEFGEISIDRLYFDHDLENMYDTYSNPWSSLLVAVKNKEIIGTAALKPLITEEGKLVEGYGEFKHFFIKSEYRGQGTGCRLFKKLLSEARAIGYRHGMGTVSSIFRDLPQKMFHCGFTMNPFKIGSGKYDKEFVLDL